MHSMQSIFDASCEALLVFPLCFVGFWEGNSWHGTKRIELTLTLWISNTNWLYIVWLLHTGTCVCVSTMTCSSSSSSNAVVVVAYGHLICVINFGSAHVFVCRSVDSRGVFFYSTRNMQIFVLRFCIGFGCFESCLKFYSSWEWILMQSAGGIGWYGFFWSEIILTAVMCML